MYPPELEIKDTTESNTSASYLDLLLSIGRDGQLRTSLYDKRDDFNFHITNFQFLSSNIPSSPAYGVFISQLLRYARACSSYEYFILRAMRLSNKLLGQGYAKERLKSSLRKFYGQYGDLTKQYEAPLSRMLHDILDDDHIQWHPPLIGHYTHFSSPEPKAQVSYCHSAPSVVRPSGVRRPSSVRRPSVCKLSHFRLLLQNHLMDFDETW